MHQRCCVGSSLVCQLARSFGQSQREYSIVIAHRRQTYMNGQKREWKKESESEREEEKKRTQTTMLSKRNHSVRMTRASRKRDFIHSMSVLGKQTRVFLMPISMLISFCYVDRLSCMEVQTHTNRPHIQLFTCETRSLWEILFDIALTSKRLLCELD